MSTASRTPAESEVAGSRRDLGTSPADAVAASFYQPTPRELLLAFWQGLALRVSTRNVLVVGPYVGEFGHEIMDFQSYVRWLRRRYREVHVITFPGREPLYRGCVVHTHNYDLRTAGYLYGKISHGEIRRYALEFARSRGLRRFDLFSTAHLRTRWHRRLLFRQEHEIIRPLRPSVPNRKILFHFRHMEKTGPDTSRNFRPELGEQVCRLCRSRSLEIGCIGHPAYSLCPEGCEDYRTENLEETVAHLAACKLVVGELSGPIHLAAYCAKPIVIWAPGRDRINNALRRNPFGVSISVVRDNTTNPAPDEIVSKISSAISAA